MTIGGNTYLITQIPSSLAPSSSNVHPPPYSRGPSSRHMATSQVCTAVTRPIVSQVHIPPTASGGYIHPSSGQLVTSRAYIPTSGIYVPPFGAYLPTYGVSHGTSHAMTYGPCYGSQYGQVSSPYEGGYQQPDYSPNYGFVAPTSQGPPYYGTSTPPYTGQTGLSLFETISTHTYKACHEMLYRVT